MIPKKDMVPGMYYKGICRGTYVAKWDDGKKQFLHLNYTCGQYYLDSIPHFEDVKDKRLDGFIPVEEVNALPREVYQKERADAGY